ncbi:MAG TPA: translational GTPase TypA [Eubacteriales bacterium]|mgnify:CR=1 FL=1|nr:translational GTPase TypA [Eubacteriales bacterium]
MKRDDLRNVAIIAHVDHGKTTLVDELLKQSGTFRANQQVAERVMDSGELERERGITILAKNTAVNYGGIKINIIDTPGHADFGGEVERVLKMVSGVLLLVDALEGPMPQTRFVLGKALELKLKIILVVNKIDRPDARIKEVVDEILELLMDMNATDEQLNSPVVYCSARQGRAGFTPETANDSLKPLFDTIIDYVEPPEVSEEGGLQLLTSSIDYNDYVGRIGIGRIERGTAVSGADIVVCDYNNLKQPARGKLVNLYLIEGLKRVPVARANAGDIVCFSGIEDITIGDTVCSPDAVEPLSFVKITEPTVEMIFSVNDSPFAGREGKYVTTRQIRDRLNRELLKDVALRVENTSSTDAFRVLGRGEMHLSILIETMRRDGYEFQVSTPKVMLKTINGVVCEPVDKLVVDVPSEYVGAVMSSAGARRGELAYMQNIANRVRLEFNIPSRGLFGYKNELLTETRGEAVMSAVFNGYEPMKGEIPRRTEGSLVAFETGEATTYGLFNAQERGLLFIDPVTPVYEGMVVGVSPKAGDIVVNVCKKKHVTNIRAAGSDEALRLNATRKFSLEECLEFLNDDELLEVTPKSLRIRKRTLSREQRMKQMFKS